MGMFLEGDQLVEMDLILYSGHKRLLTVLRGPLSVVHRWITGEMARRMFSTMIRGKKRGFGM